MFKQLIGLLNNKVATVVYKLKQLTNYQGTWYRLAKDEVTGYLYAVVLGGNVYRSIDGGYNWTILTGFGNGAWEGIAAYNGIIYACRYNGYIYKSTDNGLTASTILPTGFTSRNWYAISTYKKYVIVGDVTGLITFSADNGVNWTNIKGVSSGNCISLSYNKALNAFDIAGYYNSRNGIFRYLIDSSSFVTLKYGGFLDFKTRGNVSFAIAEKDYLYKSTDNGASWNLITVIGKLSNARLDFKDDLVVITTYSGNTYKSTDGGTTWSVISEIPITNNNIDVLIDDYNKVYIAGSTFYMYYPS